MSTKPEASKPLLVPRARPSWLWVAIVAAVALMALWRFVPGSAALTPAPTIGGPFVLTDAAGHRVTEADLTGKPYAIFFGYTHCPDVCPTTLQDMTDWLQGLGKAADKLRFVFVTVDPERDTPAVLSDYMHAFDPRILALTGTPDEVAKMLVAYRVYAKKGEVKDGTYTMDHTAAVYLMDGTGKLRTVIGFGEQPDAALARLKELIGAG